MPTSSPRAHTAKSKAAPEPVLFPRSQVACGLCGLCCTYVTVDIAPPNSVKNASMILWYLYHENVSVYWDREEDWYVQFDTRCRFFAEDRSCEIYARRPDICRDYDERECEVNAADEGLQFYEPAEFLAWLAQRRPKLHARLVAAKFVPDAAMLRRPVPVRKPLGPFAKRSRALRDLGAVKITGESVAAPKPAAASAAPRPSTPAAARSVASRRASRSRPVPR